MNVNNNEAFSINKIYFYLIIKNIIFENIQNSYYIIAIN